MTRPKARGRLLGSHRDLRGAYEEHDKATKKLVCIRLLYANDCRDARREAGVSLRAWARELELSAPYISDFERGNRWSDRIADRYYKRFGGNHA